LVQVKAALTAFLRDPAQGFIELTAQSQRAERKTSPVKHCECTRHEYVLPVSYLAANKSDVSLLVDLILECVKTEILRIRLAASWRPRA